CMAAATFAAGGFGACAGTAPWTAGATGAAAPGAGDGARGAAGMRGAALPDRSSKATCTGRWNHSAAKASIWWEQLLRTQSSLNRLGAATRNPACVSSYASGTSGLIQALICWGGSSCSRRLTQVCQKSFMSLLFKPRFYLAWGQVIHRPDVPVARVRSVTV